MALDLNDKTSNGNTLTNNNGATEITTSLPFAQSSKAVQLAAASSQYLSAVDSPSLSITGDLTIEMRLKLTSLPVNNGAFMALCSKGAPANYSWLFALYQAAGVVNFYHEFSSDGSGSTDASSYAWTPSIGVWYHVALVYTAASKTYKIFVDGVQVGSTFTGTRNSIFDSTDPLLIGAYNAASPQLFLNAQIDEFRLWSAARTSTQLADNKDVEQVGNEANLAAYWPFEPLNQSSPSASVSPSASRSPSASLSPSASRSPSSSVSASVSASVSPSASISASSSVSPSASISASASPSSSISPSLSPSPSQGYALFSRGSASVLPNDTTDLAVVYTEQEEARVETRNKIYVDQEGAAAYILHQFKIFVGQAPFCQVEFEGKSTLAPEDSPVYLQVYNQHTNAWQTIDSNGTAEEDENFELEEKLRDTTNYRDGQNIITCRVYQLAI